MALTVKWGEIKTFDGKIYKDCKLKGKQSLHWDWNEFGTHHDPGIQIEDLYDVLDKNTKIVILSKGMKNVLKTMPETLKALKDRKILVYHLQTEEAVKKYNELVDIYGDSLIALIHSTC